MFSLIISTSFSNKISKTRDFYRKPSPISRNSHPEVFLRKGVLKICSKFTRGHTFRSAISIKLICNCIKIALQHGCPPVNLVYIFRIPFPRNTSGWLLLYFSWLYWAKSNNKQNTAQPGDHCKKYFQKLKKLGWIGHIIQIGCLLELLQKQQLLSNC